MFKKVMSLSFQRLLPVLSYKSKPLAFLFVIAYPISLYFNIQLEGFRVPTPDMEVYRILVMLGQAIFEYIFQTIKIVFVVSIAADFIRQDKDLYHSNLSMLKANLGQVIVEKLRCVLAIAWRSLLLIIPGFYEYIRLMFVEPIVVLNPDYHKGQIDALEESRNLSKGHRATLFGAWIFFLAFMVGYNLLAVNVIPTGIFQHFMVYTGGFVIEVVLALFIVNYYFELTDSNRIQIEE